MPEKKHSMELINFKIVEDSEFYNLENDKSIIKLYNKIKVIGDYDIKVLENYVKHPSEQFMQFRVSKFIENYCARLGGSFTREVEYTIKKSDVSKLLFHLFNENLIEKSTAADE